MSLQMTIAKILAGQPNGRATIASLNEAILVLYKSGRQWTDRINRLSEHARDLDLFGQGLVLRDAGGWQLTKAGRAFVDELDEFEMSARQLSEISRSSNFRKPIMTPANGRPRRIA